MGGCGRRGGQETLAGQSSSNCRLGAGPLPFPRWGVGHHGGPGGGGAPGGAGVGPGAFSCVVGGGTGRGPGPRTRVAAPCNGPGSKPCAPPPSPGQCCLARPKGESWSEPGDRALIQNRKRLAWGKNRGGKRAKNQADRPGEANPGGGRVQGCAFVGHWFRGKRGGGAARCFGPGTGEGGGGALGRPGLEGAFGRHLGRKVPWGGRRGEKNREKEWASRDAGKRGKKAPAKNWAQKIFPWAGSSDCGLGHAGGPGGHWGESLYRRGPGAPFGPRDQNGVSANTARPAFRPAAPDRAGTGGPPCFSRGAQNKTFCRDYHT